MEDRQLLEEYVTRGSERAFREIVARYTDMVYSACLRQLHDRQFAEDATQAVFLALSQKARKVWKERVLSGWLLRAAMYASTKTLRMEARRKKHEKEAGKMRGSEMGAGAEWERIALVLDKALLCLGGKDRNLITLRYFHGKSHAGAAKMAGLSKNAAEKRGSRALAKLRKFFSKKGITVSVAALGVLIGENAVQAAPDGLAASSVATVLVGAGGGAVSGSIHLIAEGGIKMMLWAKVKLIATCAVAMLVIGGGTSLAINTLAQEKKIEKRAADDGRIGFAEEFDTTEGWMAGKGPVPGMKVENGVAVFKTKIQVGGRVHKEYNKVVDLDKYHYVVMKVDKKSMETYVYLGYKGEAYPSRSRGPELVYVSYTTGLIAQDITPLGIKGKRDLKLWFKMYPNGREFRVD